MSRLKELRLMKGLKQSDICKYMKIAKSTYSYWENGRTEPDQASLIKLAEFYQVTTDYLLEVEKDPIEIQPQKTSKVVAYGRNGTRAQYELNESEMQAIMTILDRMKKDK